MIQFLGRIAPRERKRMSSQFLDGSRCIGSGASGSVFATRRPAVPRGQPRFSDHCDAHLCRGRRTNVSIDCPRVCVKDAIYANIGSFAKMHFRRAYTRMIS
jgi:hypothetical protein